METKNSIPIIGHIGVIRPRTATRRRKPRQLTAEEKERLIKQAKTAYEIRITPSARVSD